MTPTTSYNQIAGKNLERLAALSDGVFAIAMTLLVLDLKVPSSINVQTEHDMWRALVALAPRLTTYFSIGLQACRIPIILFYVTSFGGTSCEPLVPTNSENLPVFTFSPYLGRFIHLGHQHTFSA
jgi:hypothetical protein